MFIISEPINGATAETHVESEAATAVTEVATESYPYIQSLGVKQQYFFDTCALLNLSPDDLSNIPKLLHGHILLSYTTLCELEDIKTKRSRDDATKAAARTITAYLDSNPELYTVVNPTLNHGNGSADRWSNDCTIISDYLDWVNESNKEGRAEPKPQAQPQAKPYFVTDDLCCANLVRAINHDLGLKCPVLHSYDILPYTDPYQGYIAIAFTDEELAQFYTDLSNDPAALSRQYNVRSNEYVLIYQLKKNEYGQDIADQIDSYVYRDSRLVKVESKRSIDSIMLGKIKPKDIYQTFAIDSILNNTLTFLTGRAGSGKSLISLATIMSLIDKGKYTRLIIMTNPIKARGAADTGFLPGDNNEKLLGQSIGNMLTTKFGDRLGVERLIDSDKLRLVSMADVRGMEIRDDEILYITEAQNMSVDLMKLCLSRASSGCKIVIEGDFEAQVDSRTFEGGSNGLKRSIEKLCGDPAVGYVHLPNVWRSKIAQLVEKL